jgi:multiple antibiotic resistance protein
MLQKLISDFVTLFVVLDPVGALAIFLAITHRMKPSERRLAAVLSIIYSFVTLLFFIVAGELLLVQMGIPLRAFQIAGGILLFLYGVEMSLGSAAPGGAFADGEAGGVHTLAVYPLAIPAIAGPGTMLTVVLLTDNRAFSIWQQALTTAVLAVTLSIFLAILLAANPIMRILGSGGANVLRRVMGILLSAIAANMVLDALQSWLGLPDL